MDKEEYSTYLGDEEDHFAVMNMFLVQHFCKPKRFFAVDNGYR